MRGMMECTRVTECRSCGGSELLEILDLGCTPLANRLVAREDLDRPEPRFPLKLVFCPACTLVQITDTVSPEILFRDYVYYSSFSDDTLAHSRRHAESLITRRGLTGTSLVVEAASNDGYLLQYFVEKGVPVLGIEPAENVARVANERGIPTRAEFFDLDCARALREEGMAADVILGNNVLAHVSDLNGFVGAAAHLLKDDGLVEYEFPHVGDLVQNVEFDTIYHEHLCYFSAHAIERLFDRHGLVFTDVRKIPIHGGSLRVTGAGKEDPEGRERVEKFLDEERVLGIDRFDFYRDFGVRVTRLKERLTATLRDLKSQGNRIVAYGASAKGSTLLNVFDIGRDVLDHVIDRSTVKQGKYTPGTHLEILPPDRLLEERPDYTLLLTWNFADEILEQQSAYRDAGGRFIIPIPEVQIV